MQAIGILHCVYTRNMVKEVGPDSHQVSQLGPKKVGRRVPSFSPSPQGGQQQVSPQQASPDLPSSFPSPQSGPHRFKRYILC